MLHFQFDQKYFFFFDPSKQTSLFRKNLEVTLICLEKRVCNSKIFDETHKMPISSTHVSLSFREVQFIG